VDIVSLTYFQFRWYRKISDTIRDLLVMGGILSGNYAAGWGEDCPVSGHEAPVLRDDAPLGGADHSVLRGQQASLVT
jgi:hypothetical protein